MTCTLIPRCIREFWKDICYHQGNILFQKVRVFSLQQDRIWHHSSNSVTSKALFISRCGLLPTQKTETSLLILLSYSHIKQKQISRALVCAYTHQAEWQQCRWIEWHVLLCWLDLAHKKPVLHLLLPTFPAKTPLESVCSTHTTLSCWSDEILYAARIDTDSSIKLQQFISQIKKKCKRKAL